MRSTSSRSTSVSNRSNGPENTSRSSSRSATCIVLRTLTTASDGRRRSDAHRGPDLGQGLAGHGAGLLGAGAEDVLQRRLVAAQLLVALAHRGEPLDDRLGGRGLEVAVAARVGHVGLDLLGGDAARDRLDLDEVRDARLVRPTADL